MRRLATFTPCGVLGVVGFVLFQSTGRDDAYLTYWPARTLAESGEILSYNGERLEQSSSLLHTVLLAIVSKVSGISVPAAGWGLGVVAGIATAVVAVVVAERIEAGSGWRAGAFVATTAYLVYWSFGGLETSLAVGALLVALLALERLLQTPRRAVLAALALLPYLTVRPESPVVLGAVAAACIVLCLAGRRWSAADVGIELTGAIRALVAVVVGSVAIVAFRLAYFGEPVPQPVRTKASRLRIGDGLDYLTTWLSQPAAIALALVAGIALVVGFRRLRTLEALLWLGAVAQLSFVVGTGGDWMEAGRFVVPLLTVLAILAAIGVQRSGWKRPLSAAVLGLQIIGLLQVAREDSTGRPVWATFETGPVTIPSDLPWYESTNKVHLRDAAFLPVLTDVVHRLHEALGRPIVVGSGQAGMAMYYVFERLPGEVRFIDRGRLTGDAFSRCEEGLVSSQFGEVMVDEYWFAHTEECGVGLPDVAFELGRFADRGFEDLFVEVSQQPGGRIVTRGSLPGDDVPTAEWVAVRRDLAALVGLDETG